MRLLRRILFAGALPALAGVGATQALADPAVERFYSGKSIQMIIGSGAGGGYDVYARLVVRHLGGHIPGKPNIIPQNMPGAGGVVGANYVANVAPKDGTAMAATQREIPLVQLMGQKGPRYKAGELHWLASLSSEPGVCAIATRTGVKSFADIFNRDLTIGGTGPNITEFFPAMLNNLLGARYRLIKGYPSTPQVHMAIQGGELDAICQSWASFKPQAAAMMKAGEIRPMVQMALRPEPEMTALKLPMMLDFITPERVQPGFTVDEVRAYFNLVIGTGFAGRPFFFASEVPADRVRAVRAAFAAMVADPVFKADAEKQKRDVDFVSGEEIQKVIAEMAATPPNILAKLEEQMKFRGPTTTIKKGK